MNWELRNVPGDPGEISWLASPTSGKLEPFGEVLIEVVTRTVGLNARATAYVATFELHSDDVCMCRDQSVDMAIELIVRAEASAANSRVEILNSDKAEAADNLLFFIYPIDDEGLLIENSADIQFNPVLTHNEDDVTVVCSVFYLSADDVHKGKCALPTVDKIPLAGGFNLSVTLSSGELVSGNQYSMYVSSCPKDWFYHRPTGRCVECELGKSVCRGGRELPVPKKGCVAACCVYSLCSRFKMTPSARYWADLEHAELGYMYTCNYPGALGLRTYLSSTSCTHDGQPV